MVFLLTGVVSFAQIGTTKVAIKNEDPPGPYDSLLNFVGKNVSQYLGQELYLKGKSESLRKYGYENFITDYTKSRLSDQSIIYKCCESYNSKYSELAGKYFQVVEIIPHPKAKPDDPLYSKKSYLKLREKESSDIVYYEYDSKFEHTFPFIVVGYFLKQKKELANREFVTRGKSWISRTEPMTDIGTGKPVKFDAGTTWKCVDLTIEEKYYSLSLILENELKEKIPLGLDNLKSTTWVFTKEDADNYKAKFGFEDWSTILNSKLKIGFTEEMTILSWGKPDKINRSSSSDQWVYDGQYLYFENGKLKSFN